MSMLIKHFADGSVLEYDQGSFDPWCVYLTRPGKPRLAPTDVQYFTVAVELGNKYSNHAVYADFVKIFDLVRIEKCLSATGHGLIEALLANYAPDALRMDILFTILYASMVAEERKEHTRLGARIKRLGMHQILMDSPVLSVAVAAQFSRGMKWQDIDAECSKRGF